MEQKKKRTGLYIALIIGGVILVAAIVTVILFLLDGSKNKNQNVKPSEVVTETEGKKSDDTVKMNDTENDDDSVENEAATKGDNPQNNDTQPVAVSNKSIKAVNASSVLQPQGTDEDPYLYYALNAIDGKSDTAWVEGVDGNGENEWIEFTLDGEYDVNGIEIANGYRKSSDIFMKNGRVKQARIIFSDGTSMDCELTDSAEGMQRIDFASAVKTNSVRLQIVSVYPGSKYTDTCISEVNIY